MIATVALMASCTGNGTTSGSASAGSTENKEEAAEDTIKGPATVENATWQIDVPEGWYVESNSPGETQAKPSYLRMKPYERPKGVYGLVGVTVRSYPYESNTVEQTQDSFKKANKLEDLKPTDVTVGDLKFSCLSNPGDESNGPLAQLAAPLPKGNVSIEVQGYDLTEEVIDAVIKSFKLKPAEAAE